MKDLNFDLRIRAKYRNGNIEYIYNEYDNAYYMGNLRNPYLILVKAKNTSITSCSINEKAKVIYSYAFRGCIGLTSITIPDSITEIGEDPFYNCSSLTYNEYDNAYYLGNANNPYVVLVHAKNTSITSCIVNDKTKLIYSNAFDGCSGLKSVTIPTSVTSIGDSAFRNCSSLTSITIPDSVTSIGYEAFKGCSNIKFNEYDNTYYLGNNNNLYVVLVKAKNTSITSCSINEKAKVIYSYAFYGCSGLTSITIPNSVTSIGNSAFSGCSKLTSITIPNSVTSIGNFAFYGCSGLTSVTLPNSVTSIGNSAFSGCSKLTSITIPNSVTSIGNFAFYGCSSLTSVTLPNSVTSIGDGVFSDCSGLTSVTLPNSVTSIGNFAFYGCSKLKTISIPNKNLISNMSFICCDKNLEIIDRSEIC